MNKKALYAALVYSTLVIAYKLFIVTGGYALSKFGYYYSGIVSVFFIIPFYIFTIKSVRDKDLGGFIAGREAMRISLTLFAISALVLSVYHYIEYEQWYKALSIEYYNSEQFLEFLQKRTPTKPEDYGKVIAEQISDAEHAAFKATTGKLFSFMLIGLSSAFITSAIMKRKPGNNISI